MNKYQKIFLAAILVLSVLLRFYKLSSNPPGLYWDETAFGYDAYSILKTAHDHHGHFMPLVFESFGDWKLPAYFYILVPSIKIFGLTEFAVRFPSAFFGVLTVFVLFFIVRKLAKDTNLSLLASFFLAISPWHIQFSRGGFESTVGLFFVLSGFYLFLSGLEKGKSSTFTFAFLLFISSMYTYHAYRIFVPFFIIFLAAIFIRNLKKLARQLMLPIVIAVLLLLPLAKLTFSQEGRARATSQSAFKDQEFRQSRLDYDQKSKKPLRFMSRYLYQKPLYYSYVAAKSYLDHFSPVFLFFKGDQIGRHSQVDMGQIHIFEAIFLIAAVFTFKKNRTNKIMLGWLLLAPIPAIIVSPAPHAYRTLQMSVPLAFFSGLGAYPILSHKKLLTLKIIFGAFVLYWFLSYLHLLFVHYPKKFAADWQDGYREMVHKVLKYQNNYENVYITNINQVPYIYVLFYGKYDPQKFTSEKGTREHFDKYYFISSDTDVYNKGRILYVAPSWQKVDGKWLDAVNDSSGRHIYSLWEIGGAS